MHPLYQQETIRAAASSEGVDPYLVAAVVNVESGFRATVRSSAGAVGLMQVKPSTAKAVARRIGVAGPMNEDALKDPVVNIRVGTAYLAELLARYHGNRQLALAAYNAGITNADGWAARWDQGSTALSSRIGFPETVNYVGEVLAQTEVYRSLYPGVFAASPK
jgi:soluble lytic murein transglycosylase